MDTLNIIHVTGTKGKVGRMRIQSSVRKFNIENLVVHKMLLSLSPRGQRVHSLRGYSEIMGFTRGFTGITKKYCINKITQHHNTKPYHY